MTTQPGHQHRRTARIAAPLAGLLALAFPQSPWHALFNCICRADTTIPPASAPPGEAAVPLTANSIAPQAKVSVVVRLIQGRPTVLRGGKPVQMSAFCDSIMWQESDWRRRLEPFIRNGVKVFHVGTGNWEGVYGQSEFWMGEDVYPDVNPSQPGFTLESRVAYIRSRVPDALFVVRLHTVAPRQWVERNPDQMQSGADGKKFDPSWASEKYLAGVSRHFQRVVQYCESQPWGDRVLGYLIVPMGEGLQEHTLGGNFYDRSPAMQTAWSQWLKTKYSSDEALRLAWQQPDISLASAGFPTDAQLRLKIGTLPHWPQSGALVPELDYVALQRKLYQRWFTTLTKAVADGAHRPVLVGIDALKAPMLGWQIQEEFSAHGQTTASFPPLLASGCLGVGQYLDLPWITNLMNPQDYHARGVGFGFETEGLNDSLVLRGKALMVENDARTYLAQETSDRRPTMGSFMNIDEVRAGLRRNTAASLARGMLPYWTDIGFNASYFSDPTIGRELKGDLRLQQQGALWPQRETENAIAVIIDDESPLYENFTTGFQNLALLRQRIEGLDLCGIPYRQYLLSDLERENFPRYRCYLFPDLFKVDDHVIALLQRKVLRDGAIAIFGPGTGITDGLAVSAAGAEKLLGIPMQLCDATCARRIHLRDRSAAALHASAMPATYGDSYAYGPVLIPQSKRLSPDVLRLGDAVLTWNINEPGLVLKNFGKGGRGDGTPGERGAKDYAVVFSAAVPLPPALLRSLARYGGCNIWCDADVALFGNHSVVAVHSTDSRSYTLNLPWKPAQIVDAVSGQVVARNTAHFSVGIQAPDTRVYILK